MKSKLKFVNQVRKQLGLLSAIRYFTCFILDRVDLLPKQYTLTSRRARYPLICRRGTSDLSVFNQVFILGEYDCVDCSSEVKIVFDCGANVGYSAAYFLSRFSQCAIVAIEPDAGNYKILEQNLQPYRDRAKTIKAAIWPHVSKLELVDTLFRGGHEWAFHVQEPSDCGGQEIEGIDLLSVFQLVGTDHVDILKVDIEGAEVPLFSGPNIDRWLGKIDLIAIELHADSVFGDGVQCFENIMRDKPFTLQTYEEITVARRIHSASTE